MSDNKKQTPLFVLHGGPALNNSYLARALGPLATRVKPCFFDYPKNGSFPAIVSYVAEEIDQNSSGGFSVLAHSWGSPLLLAVLSKLKNGPERAVLVTPFPVRLAEAETYFTAIRERIEKSTTDLERKRIDQIDSNPDPKLDHEYTRLIAPAYVHDRRNAGLVDFSSYDRAEAGRIFSSMGDYDFSSALSLLPERTLLLLGESDFLTPKAAEPYRQRASRVRLFPQTGHSPFLECPQDFFKEVVDFLEKGE